MNEKIKSKVKSKTQLCKVYIKNGRNEVHSLNLKNSIAELNDLVSTTKTSYYEKLEKIQMIQVFKLNLTGLFPNLSITTKRFH